MFPKESRRTRRSGRNGRRPVVAARVESLESRELLAYSPIGIPLPDLSVTGYPATVATWGSALAINATISNNSASSIIQPLSLEPGAVSTADAPASQLGVYVSASPRNLKGGIEVGRISVPAIPQNSIYSVVNGIVTLPNRPAGFPGDGGKIYVYLKADDAHQMLESDVTNNLSAPVATKVEAPFPELAVVGFDVPPVMSPGDTIQPNIRIANLGTADTGLQGPVQIALVASTSPTFTTGSSIVATYTVGNIPAQSLVATNGPALGDANLIPGNNIVTIPAATDPKNIVTLPTAPGQSYLGVVIDPHHQLKQLNTIPQGRRGVTPLSLPHLVGQSNTGLPPAGVNYPGGASLAPVFPYSQSGYAVGASQDGTYPPSIYSISTVSQQSIGGNGLSATSTTSTIKAAGYRSLLASARAQRLAMISQRSATRHGMK